MKKALIILAVVFFAACQQVKTPDQLKQKITEHKEKIKELEIELSKIDTISSNGNGNKVKVNILKADFTKTTHSFTVTGNVDAVNFALVSPEANGKVNTIHVRKGQSVSKGQLLVSLSASAMMGRIKELKQRLELAKTVYEKQKKLWDQKIGKEIDYLKAKNDKESLEANLMALNAQFAMTKVKAPFSGIIDEIYPKLGEMATPGRPVVDLVNLHKLEIKADISEKYLSSVVKGGVVTVSFPAYPDLKIEGKIHRTGNIINPTNRTFKIEIKINNQANKIKPNMVANILLSDYEGNNITVPSLIIKSDTKGKFIFVVKENDGEKTAEKRYIKTGLHTGERTIIEEGINKGEKIIIDGYNIVKNGTPVKIYTK